MLRSATRLLRGTVGNSESLLAPQPASSAGLALCRKYHHCLRQFSRECGTDQCSWGFPAWGGWVALRLSLSDSVDLRRVKIAMTFPSTFLEPGKKASQGQAVESRRFRAARRGGRATLSRLFGGGDKRRES